MGENICKPGIWWLIDIYIYIYVYIYKHKTHIYKHIYIKKSFNSVSRKETMQLKNGQRIWITFFQGTHTDGQQTHEKMVNIANHWGNMIQNHNEIFY